MARTPAPIIALGDHDFLVPSDTVAGRRYQTTRFSCNCQGFARYGKPGWTCKHVRAVRAQFGMPLVPFPRRPAVASESPNEAA